MHPGAVRSPDPAPQTCKSSPYLFLLPPTTHCRVIVPTTHVPVKYCRTILYISPQYKESCSSSAGMLLSPSRQTTRVQRSAVRRTLSTSKDRIFVGIPEPALWRKLFIFIPLFPNQRAPRLLSVPTRSSTGMSRHAVSSDINANSTTQYTQFFPYSLTLAHSYSEDREN